VKSQSDLLGRKFDFGAIVISPFSVPLSFVRRP
jgi:hypothetical protein